VSVSALVGLRALVRVETIVREGKGTIVRVGTGTLVRVSKGSLVRVSVLVSGGSSSVRVSVLVSKGSTTVRVSEGPLVSGGSSSSVRVVTIESVALRVSTLVRGVRVSRDGWGSGRGSVATTCVWPFDTAATCDL